MAFTLESNLPRYFSFEELTEFRQAILEGGEVDADGLRDRILSARALVLLREAEKLAATAALKVPVPTYRARVSESAGVELAVAQYPFELGWVYVYPFARGRKYSHEASREALSRRDGRGVFATSRTDNVAMHATLRRLGFGSTGAPYRSRRGDRELQLFLRPGDSE